MRILIALFVVFGLTSVLFAEEVKPKKGATINKGKLWSEMTPVEKKASMDRLKALNFVVTMKTLRENGYKNLDEYNANYNPTFNQLFAEAKEKWLLKNNLGLPIYRHGAWRGTGNASDLSLTRP